MPVPKLKVRPLPDCKPTKLSVAIEPELMNDLRAYAAVYEQTYGQSISVAALVPSMLRALLDADHAFKRGRRELSENEH